MMLRILAASATAAVAMAGNSNLRVLNQPSAKFAATWENEPIVAADCINGDEDSVWGNHASLSEICNNVASNTEGNTNNGILQLANLGKLKVPGGKEALVGLSTQIGIFTLNTAKSKKGPSQTEYYGNIGATRASAQIDVVVDAINAFGDVFECAPGPVTLQSRQVEIRHQIGGNATYEDCYNEDLDQDGIPSNFTCVTKIADLELQSSIGLAMTTVSASSFQFVCPDLPTGTYVIAAQFSLGADAQDLCEASLSNDCTDIADPSASRIVLGTRMLTAQIVRAVKGSLEVE